MTRVRCVLGLLLFAGALGGEARGTESQVSPALALAALDRKIADLDAEEQATRKAAVALGPHIGEKRARALALGRQYYKLTRAGVLAIGGGFDALITHAMRVERSRRTLENDLSEEHSLRMRAVELGQDLEHLARDRASLAGQRSALEAGRLALEEEGRRKAAFARAFESSEAPEFVPIAGLADDSQGGFLSARGRLLMPVATKVQTRTARRDDTDGPGLEILCGEGSVVRAVYAGRVAFADRYGSYGRIVIVDHGDHYYTVSGNLGAVDVRVGQEIVAGERLGTVGNDGDGPMLYFEVRHGSQTLQPAPWLGL